MFEGSQFTRTITILKKGLDAEALRQQVIADNIANVNTPGFKRSTVSFQAELRKAIKKKGKLQAITTHPKHIKFGGYPTLQSLQPKIIVEIDTRFREDGNNVDIHTEMADLTKSIILYNAMVARISGKFRALKDVILRGGR